MVERDAMLAKRSVTAVRDMSTPLLTKPRCSSKRATSRTRAVTASRRMSTTGDLLQSLHVHQILRSSGGQLERYEAFPRNHAHTSAFDLRGLPILPCTLENASDQKRIEHERQTAEI